MKAILVLNEMPENCDKCRIRCEHYYSAYKNGTTKSIKPDSCPLRPAPEKRQTTDDFWQGCVNIVRNACID